MYFLLPALLSLSCFYEEGSLFPLSVLVGRYSSQQCAYKSIHASKLTLQYFRVIYLCDSRTVSLSLSLFRSSFHTNSHSLLSWLMNRVKFSSCETLLHSKQLILFYVLCLTITKSRYNYLHYVRVDFSYLKNVYARVHGGVYTFYSTLLSVFRPFLLYFTRSSSFPYFAPVVCL